MDIVHIRVMEVIQMGVLPFAAMVRCGAALLEVALICFSIFVSIYIPQVAICPLGSGLSTLHGW